MTGHHRHLPPLDLLHCMCTCSIEQDQAGEDIRYVDAGLRKICQNRRQQALIDAGGGSTRVQVHIRVVYCTAQVPRRSRKIETNL